MPSKRPSVSFVHLSTAGKWIAASVTTAAAIIGLVVNARNLGLTPWLNIGTIRFADLAARRVLVTPVTDTLRAIGDTLHLAATITDEHGATLAGATILWSTEDSAVAVVDSSGGVAARGPGLTTVFAAVREHAGSARIAVYQRVRSVVIAHDTVLRLAEGAAVQLASRALDARGHLVQGRGAKWTSADSAIVAVSPSGTASATGTGRTTLTVSVEGYSAILPAEVTLTPASVKLVTGGEQRAPAGRALPEGVRVQVFSRGGRSVPEATVTFATDADDGKVEPASALTDRNGRAHVAWTLGSRAGRQRLLITVAGLDSALSVVAEADPVHRNTRAQVVDEPLHGVAGAALKDSVRVRVTDSTGAAAADVPVAWSALDGGHVEVRAPRTDSLGESWVRWTLGPRAGTQRARIQVGNPRTMPAVTATVAVVADSAATITLVSGGGQEGRVGAGLRRPIIVKLADRYGNAVAGTPLMVTALAGSVADSAPVSDADGRVPIHWTLGSKAGTESLELTLGGGKPLHVSARATALEAANIALGAVPSSAAAGQRLAKPVVATVTDVYGNVVAGAPVSFTVTTGSLSPARAMTDAKGEASTRWTLGAGTLEQLLSASVRGTSVKTTASVRGTKPSRH